ncbi:hypothetical protein ACHWQZ_G005833 [Mnemiopsis leidyi]
MTLDNFSPPLDKVLASLLTLTLLLGVPLNILSFRHFYNTHRTSTSKLIFMIVSLTDTFSCLNTYPVILVLFSGRRPVLYTNYTFTQFWGITWEPLPYFSVFLVVVMTTVRAIILIKPLYILSRRIILGIISGYYLFLLARFCTGLIFFGYYEYRTFSGYAWIQINNNWYGKVDICLAVILLAAPILPILLLSSISVYRIVRSIKRGTKNRRLAAIKRKSSVTVMIFAATYTIFNVPVFFTYLWWDHPLKLKSDEFLGQVFKRKIGFKRKTPKRITPKGVLSVSKAFTVILKGLLEDSRSFNGDPPHLTLNHGFLVIRLSRPKKIA